MRRDQIGKINENLTAHLLVPGQRILLRETTVTDTEKTWRIEIEQRSLYVWRVAVLTMHHYCSKGAVSLFTAARNPTGEL